MKTTFRRIGHKTAFVLTRINFSTSRGMEAKHALPSAPGNSYECRHITPSRISDLTHSRQVKSVVTSVVVQSVMERSSLRLNDSST